MKNTDAVSRDLDTADFCRQRGRLLHIQTDQWVRRISEQAFNCMRAYAGARSLILKLGGNFWSSPS
jgi:hypothetical protein